MRSLRDLGIWSAIGLAGAALLAWSFPRAFPLLPAEWSISRAEAEAIALERLRDLGEPVEGGYVAVHLLGDLQLERRLQLVAAEVGWEAVRDSAPARDQLLWEVFVYAPAADSRNWAYRAQVTRTGEVLLLLKQTAEPGEGELPDDGAALQRSARYLERQGFDLARFAEPEIQRDEVGTRDQLQVRYPMREDAVGNVVPYGVAVRFEGDGIYGFATWLDEPDRDELRRIFRQGQVVGMGQWVVLYFLLPLVAVPFLRRYHDGQLGVRRGVQLLLLGLAAGLVLVLLNSRIFAEGSNIGFLSRRQTTWFIGGFVLVGQFFPLAALGLMSWSVGEFFCRQRWPQKLASMDALFRLKWNNATVALSSLRGLAGGLVMAGTLFFASTLAQERGVWAVSGFAFHGADGPLPALANVAGAVAVVPMFLFVCLLVPCWATSRWGSALGLAVSIAAAAAFTPQVMVLPLEWGWPMAALVAAVPVLLFRFGDLLSALLAAVSSSVAIAAAPALFAGDPALQSHGWAALLLVSAPLLLSLRHLGSDSKFVYTYDDVPPHVRRIAERERQRVEIETARNIQSSILPQLPPQVNGVEIAHSYLPASEVGGDFYDVLALEDGRLAVAVGDVAGHGVSSGLVMSMAKSALAVQVTFDPEVQSVFATMNRTIYQSARRRLLSTLCYALLDPARRELLYASAGHVFPYRVSPGGDVEALTSESYPLGVRGDIDVRVRTSKVEPGDSVFLYSDGLVEATPESHDEQFGFERLEDSLRRHAAKPPHELRDAVLEDVEAFTRRQVRDDDLTVLVLRLPAA